LQEAIAMSANPLEQLERCIGEAQERGATDLFLLPGEPLSMRVTGEIVRTEGPLIEAPEIQRIAEALVGSDRVEKIGAEVGEISTRKGLPEEVNARATIARSRGNLTLSVILLPHELYTPDELHVPEALVQSVCAPSGLVVITGPVGSGMQTVGCSLVEYINGHDACHIATVEDPIRVRFTPRKAIIQQREVGVDVPDGLAGIRASIRQDADVLFVNQIRMVEELEACLAAAESGELVIVVLHVAATQEGAVQRLVEAFPEDARAAARRSLAQVLKCVSVQRLFPRIGGVRVAAYGVVVPDAEMRRALAEGHDWRKRSTPLPQWWVSIVDDIQRLEREGLITPESARKGLEEFA